MMRNWQMIAVACLWCGTPAGGGEPGFLEDDVVVLYAVDGEMGGLEFGYVAETIGDVTGDGVTEILTSAPYHPAGGPSAGRLYLLNGATGAVIRTHTGTTPGGFLGFRVAETGDLDGDGIPDYAAAAPGNQGTAVDGEVFVYSGASGDVIRHLTAMASGDRFGHGLHGPGDLDGDGTRDLLVGAPRNDTAAGDAGQVYVFSGADWSVIRTHDGAGALAWLGASVRGIGDVDDDGVVDYVVGASGDGPARHGKAYVHSGANGSMLYEMTPGDNARNFGFFFSNTPGDVTGDGVNDIFIGDHNDVTFGTVTGRAYLFDGLDGAPICSVAGENSFDWTGWGGRGVGDVNGDGRADFSTNFLTNPEVVEAPAGGRVRILSGRNCSVIRTVTSLYGTPDGTQGESFGYDSRLVDDVNADGIPDLLVTAGANYANGQRAGRLYMIAGIRHCPEDLDGDGVIGFSDIVRLLGAWGPCEDCAEDIDLDGRVGFTDLLRIPGAWGACV